MELLLSSGRPPLLRIEPLEPEKLPDEDVDSSPSFSSRNNSLKNSFKLNNRLSKLPGKEIKEDGKWNNREET